MGRKSSLTPEQWVEIERRHLVGGESINSLAAEFGVNESSIRRRIKPNKAELPNGEKPLRVLAEQKVAAEAAQRRIADQIAELPISRQRIVNDLASMLTDISEHLAAAAKFGAATAHRLSGIAHAQAAQIDDADPLCEESVVALKGISALTKMANDASEIGVNLLRANKEAVDDINKRAAEGSRVENYTDEQLDQLIAERSAVLGIPAPGQS
ncbi:Hin recombinase [Burkholderia vietnamiensis]|uniref:Hin recombinase n=1 Tax=Burkholderia vietnamiensis TaxID=60552 RepID=UPI00352C2907